MRPGGGAAKGSQFERDMCIQFGLWWTENERDDIYWRTSGSGARSTSRRRSKGKATFNEYGDMKYIDPIGKPLLDEFCFEFKNYKTYDILGVLQAVDANKDWTVFWAQAYGEAESVDRRPFLITKRNRGRILGWVMEETATEFDEMGFKPWPAIVLRINERDVKVKGHTVALPDHEVVGFDLADFLETIDARTLENYYARI